MLLHVKEKKNRVGSETLPFSIQERRHTSPKSCESPPKEDKKEAHVGLVDFRQRVSQGHQSHGECFCFNWHDWLRCIEAYKFIAAGLLHPQWREK
eukprot:636651-Pelagomonas_calceolata.AAC.3